MFFLCYVSALWASNIRCVRRRDCFFTLPRLGARRNGLCFWLRRFQTLSYGSIHTVRLIENGKFVLDTRLVSHFQVQGMSFLAAVLLLNMEPPDAFICFANLLNKPCQMAFFRVDHPMVRYFYFIKCVVPDFFGRCFVRFSVVFVSRSELWKEKNEKKRKRKCFSVFAEYETSNRQNPCSWSCCWSSFPIFGAVSMGCRVIFTDEGVLRSLRPLSGGIPSENSRAFHRRKFHPRHVSHRLVSDTIHGQINFYQGKKQREDCGVRGVGWNYKERVPPHS